MQKWQYKRCVHLDFHTSEYIEKIGENFDAKAFAKRVKDANIESMTVFAKCHHGWTYYPSKYGETHPHLKFDLLKAQVDALHAEGVKAPVYYPIGWSHNDARLYPECIYRGADGSVLMESGKFDGADDEPRPNASWVTLCHSGKYRELIYNQIREICDKFDVLDGLFLDICHSSPNCRCPNCVKNMREKGIDEKDPVAIGKYTVARYREFEENIRSILKEKHPDASLFFNSCGCYLLTDFHEFCSHYEMEDLPSIQGGYNKLPLQAAYFDTTGKEYMGMTGKFYTLWGEFGGIKSYPALKVEACQMLTYGAGMSIGDALHPSGELDETTYRIIGQTYEYYKKLEEYCVGKQATANIAIMPSYFRSGDEGVAKMLLEKQIDFKVIKRTDPIEGVECLILPSGVQYEKGLADRITEFVKKGGKLLVLGDAMLDKKDGKFGVDLGLEYFGKSEYDCDYAKPTAVKLYSDSPVLMYSSGWHVKATDGESLGKIYHPYFSRTYKHWCSHVNTPYQTQPSEFDCGVKKGNVVYLPHDLGALYDQKGAQLHKDLFIAALRLIYNEERVKTELGAGGRVHLVKDDDGGRYALNVMYMVTFKRGECETVEDLLTLKDKRFSVRVPEKIKRIYSVQQDQEIPFYCVDGGVEFSADIPEGHNTLLIEF